MAVNWDVMTRIIVPLGTLVLGKYLDRWLARRPRLISYLGHTSAFGVHSTPPVTIHTHAIVVRNAGRATANQVRVGHHFLPENIQLYPLVPHTIERTEGGGAELVIPKLVPGEQIAISYLYFPPVLWSQIHSYIKSDEGFAKVLSVLPTPQLPKWAISALWILVFVGAVSLVYLLVDLIRWLV